MPELSNIQTFIKINDKDYSPTLEQFKQILINLDAWDEPTNRAFENPNWRDDGSCVSSELMNLEPRTTKHSGVKIRPLFQIWTPRMDPTLKSNGISCDLLIETDELIANYATGEFREYTFNFIEQLTFEMTRIFGTPTFFTNETDDGEPSDGLRTNKLWKFDYALIPVDLMDFFSTPPNSHQTRTNGQHLECWKAKLWRT